MNEQKIESIDLDEKTVDNSQNRENNFDIPDHSIKSFSDFSDYNNITNEGHYMMQYLKDHTDEFGDKVDYPDGTTHLSIGMSYEDIQAKMGEDGSNLSKFFDTVDISDSGDGAFTVEEYIYDKDSHFDALLIKDCSGNYRICYGSTDDGDVLTDVVIGMDNHSIIYNQFESMLNLNLITEQEMQARSVAQYCFDKAESNGTKLSLSGYSLGGALCENGVDSLLGKSNYEDVVDGVVLLNPLHADLSSERIEKIKNTNNFNCYVNEYDLVHTISKYDEYKDVQKVYLQDEDEIPDPNNPVKPTDAFFRGAHIIDNFSDADYIKYAFNSDGSIKTTSDGGHVANSGNLIQTLSQYYSPNIFNPFK